MDENQRQLVLDYQTLFLGTGDVGKRVQDDMAERFNFNARFELIVKTGPPEQAAFELGKREAYLYILDKIMADPNAVVQEMAETE